MVDVLVAFIQSAAVVFLGWGAYLCLFCRDRRTSKRTTAADRRGRRPMHDVQSSKVIDLASASKDRATDFEIGFRRPRPTEKLAA
jgi:hypothetical protein